MKVLSLFDGISCGYLALQRAGIPIDSYVAYEINKYAIQVSKKHHPDIIHKGDVFDADFTEYKGYDLIMGGSPCTNWSIARRDRNEGGINTGLSLFNQYVKALDEVKPKYFLYENNFRIGKDVTNTITDSLGVQPILIDSALVSAQRRKRLYWTNIPTTLPEDKGIAVSDVISPDRKWRPLEKWVYGISYGRPRVDRMPTLSRITKSGTVTTKDNHPWCYYLNDDRTMFCNFTPLEYERLQTLPDNYTEGLSKAQRCKCIGNAWTVDVIAHILSGIKHDL